MSYSGRDYYRPTGMGGFSFFPPMIKYLLIINGVVFLLQIIFENLVFGDVPGWYIMNRYFALNPIVGIDAAGQSFNFQFWQLITYQFMHANFSHILFNMFLMWMFGMEIENMWGSQKFLVFYLTCGIVAGLVQLLFAPLLSGGVAFTIGASGAVFGIMIAFAMFFPDRYIYLYFLIPIKAKYLIVFLVVIEFMSVGNMDFTAHLAHIGGAVSAFAFILLDRKYNFNFDKILRSIKNFGAGSSKSFNSKRSSFFGPQKEKDVMDAKFYDINNKDEIDQEEIDRILDKISQSGYQNLTEREKKVLFNASKHN
jgi:membrane associated rhomboid family serine protease